MSRVARAVIGSVVDIITVVSVDSAGSVSGCIVVNAISAGSVGRGRSGGTSRGCVGGVNVMSSGVRCYI